MKRITSRQNALVARYRAVAQGTEPDLLLLDGLHLVSDAADQLVESGHPGGGASDEPAGTPAQTE